MAMPLFILMLVNGYLYLNQLASEDVIWGHNRSFAFSQAGREGKLVLLSVTQRRCDFLKGLECGEGKPDLSSFVLLNVNPADTDFQGLILDDRFAEIKKGELPRYYLLNSTGEIRHSSKELPSVEEMTTLRKTK